MCVHDVRYLTWLCLGFFFRLIDHRCRRASGYDISPWAFVAQSSLRQPNAGPPFEFNEGTLRSYRSSPDVLRYFCGTCGATAFYRSANQPELVDVSVGLLESPSGARCEDFLEWNMAVDFLGDAQNKPLIAALEKGWRASTTKK